MSRKLNPWHYVCLASLVIGIGVGSALPLSWLRDRVASALPENPKDHADDEDGHEEDDHDKIVAISEPAYDSLNIIVGRVERKDYQSSYEIPALVQEMPGVSELHVATRFEGLVKQVFVTEGQSVKPGQPICEVELTSDSLAVAQSDFLDATQQIQINEMELERIRPLVRDGVMPRKNVLDLEYAQRRLQVKSTAKYQELLIRGLTENQIEQIKATRKLVRQITIKVPERLIPPQRGVKPPTELRLIADKLAAKPGSMLKTGDHVLGLAYHQKLVTVGHAFEKDLPRLRGIIENQEPVSVSIGVGQDSFELKNQRIAFVSNHADPRTNTFPFYVYIDNEVLGNSSQPQSLFVNWRWKPGQRSHVSVPDRRFTNQIVLPRDAVAVDGVRYLAFRRHVHEHVHDPNEPDHEHFMEFEVVDLIVKHVDQNIVVVDTSSELKVDDIIAMNQAGQLLYAMKGAAGGGGHAHPHAP